MPKDAPKLRIVANVRKLRFAALVALLAACATTQGRPAGERPLLAQVEAAPDQDGAVVGAAGAPATIVVSFASWCGHCRVHLDTLAEVHAAFPGVRMLGVNYRAHEEYGGRGSSSAVRTYVAEHAPWLRVVPIDEPLFTALGRPPLVPTIFVFDREGALVATYDRRRRSLPTAEQLAAQLTRLGASPGR